MMTLSEFLKTYEPTHCTLGTKASQVLDDADIQYWITAGRGRYATARYLHVSFDRPLDIVSEDSQVIRTAVEPVHIRKRFGTDEWVRV